MHTDLEQQLADFARVLDRDAPTITSGEIENREPVSIEVDLPAERSSRWQRSPWYVFGAAATLVAVLVVGLVALTQTRDESAGPAETVAPQPTLAVTTVPTSPGTATSSDGVLEDTELVGRSWIRIPTDDQYRYEYELELEFPDIGSAAGYDGCESWTSESMIDQSTDTFESEFGKVFTISFDPPPGDSTCASRQQSLIAGQVAVSPEGALHLLDENGAVEAEYVATDVLGSPSAGDLVGAWTTRSGSRIELLSDGRARLGACAPAGVWRYGDGSIELDGFEAAPAETAACAGGQLSGIIRGLTPALAEGSVTAEAATAGSNLLLRVGDRALWLQPAGPITALDLESSTSYGFGPFSDVSADFVIDTVIGVAGPATFDSGWNTIVPVDDTESADCYGGLGQRVVFWGDVRFGFLRGDFPESDRLYFIGAGIVDRDSVPRYDGPLPDLPAEPTVALQGVGPGSTVDELAAAGYRIRDEQFLDGGARVGWIVANDGVITDMQYYDPGFC